MPLKVPQPILKAIGKTLLSIISATASIAQEAFEPQVPIAIKDQWRWKELEPLSAFQVVHATESQDRILYLSTDTGLVKYDGYECSTIPYPTTDDAFAPFQVFASRSGSIFLFSSAGLYSYRDNIWTHIKEIVYEARARIATSPYGVELISLPDGIYRIEGNSIEIVPQITEKNADEIGFDGLNRLWLKVPYTNRFVQYQFEGTKVASPTQRKQYDLDFSNDAYPSIIVSPRSESVWCITWKQAVPALRFNESDDSWEPHDLTPIAGNNQHTYGFHINQHEFAIFAKSGMFVVRDGQWSDLEYPEYEAPTNRPFYLVRRNGNIIIGGYGEKTFEIEYSENGYDSYQGLHFQCDGDNGSSWFMSVGGQIVEYNKVSDSWIRHTGNLIDTPSSIFKSKDGHIWVAGAHQGTAAVCYYDGSAWTMRLHPELEGMISHLSALQLDDGRVLFGSGEDEAYDHPKGGVVYENDGSGYRSAYLAPPSFPSRPIGFAEFGADSLLAGGLGLSLIDKNLVAASSPLPPFDQDRWIDHIAEDGSGGAWIAIWDRGLFHINGSYSEQINAPRQIASNQVIYLLEDQKRKGNLWVANKRGVSRFNGRTWFPNALPKELRFNREGGTIKQSDDGSIWINLGKRDWYFRRSPNFNITKTLFNDFRTIKYKLDADAPTVRITSEKTNATSPADIFIQWEGVDKWSRTPSSELKYSFRMNDEPWSEFSASTNTVQLNVASGDHTFEVKSMDSDGNISAYPARTGFSVTPPIWRRPWFIALASAIIVVFAALIGLLFRQRIRHIIQMDEFKLQFFTNISHELRTPLTVILGPLESQLAKLPPTWDKGPLEIAYRNAKKTLDLINQILDFRSAESGNLELTLTRADLVDCARETVKLIKPLADDRSQSLDFECDTEACEAWYDTEKLESILNNLLGNAIKYTQEFGRIAVRLKVEAFREKLAVRIVVEDNGRGIPADKVDNLFKLFYRVKSPGNAALRGSGIGLAYTKNLVDAFGGTIEIESPITTVNGEPQGTRFTVSLPLDKNLPAARSTSPAPAAGGPPEHGSNESDRPTILIAEDDADIRRFIAEELREDYLILEAGDGEQALQIAKERIPDLILSDVMMPKMEGKELCRQVKAAAETCHIQIIMLTALKSDRHELVALETGADDYLTKPIRIPILKKRIHNHLESRRRLHELFAKQTKSPQTELKTIASNTIDEKFLNRALEVVEAHLENPLFDVEFFATQMGASRMSLYRKFKAVTGDSPSAFIHSIRMKHAAELLKKGEHKITEISIMSGFNDLSYFSTTFKKHFSLTPTQFAKKYGQ